MRALLLISIRAGVAWLVFLAFTSTGRAQWPNYPNPGIPRNADGKPNLSAPAPKTPDGKPDLSGVWETREDLNAFGAYKSHFMDLAIDLKPQEAPMQPWAKALSEKHRAVEHKDDPLAQCMPPGVPRIDTLGPFKIVETTPLVIIMYETTANSSFRQIFTDGRPLPVDPNPTWNGYSTAKWEGDALVVHSIGFRDDLWLDSYGNPLTEAAKVTEKIRRPNYGTLEIEMTIDDPKAYTAPWTVTMKQPLALDSELIDYYCLENEKDFKHMVGDYPRVRYQRRESEGSPAVSGVAAPIHQARWRMADLRADRGNGHRADCQLCRGLFLCRPRFEDRLAHPPKCCSYGQPVFRGGYDCHCPVPVDRAVFSIQGIDAQRLVYTNTLQVGLRFARCNVRRGNYPLQCEDG